MKKLIVLVSFFLWGCVMGGLGGAGPGGAPGQSFGSPESGDVMGLGYSNQSAMPADQSSALAAESLSGQNFGSNSMSFGDTAPSGPAAATSVGNPITSMVFPTLGSLLGTVLTGGNPLGGIVGGFIGNLVGGKGVGQSALGVPGQFAASALPGVFGMAANALLGYGMSQGMQGNLGEGQPPGATATMGAGMPGDLQGMANALMGGGMEQGMVPGVGALGAGAQPAPQAAPSQAISPSPMAQNYYGMKRVNLPWYSQPQSQNREYGMKRV